MMMLAWRQPETPIAVRWRGPDAALEHVVRAVPLSPAAAVIGPPGPSVLSGEAILVMPGGAGDWSGEAVIVAPGVQPTSRMFLSLASASDDEENDPDLIDLVAVHARAEAGAFRLSAHFSELVSGAVRFNWSAL